MKRGGKRIRGQERVSSGRGWKLELNMSAAAWERCAGKSMPVYALHALLVGPGVNL